MRNHQETLVVLCEVVLQPHARAEIQMVRGLVQQQKCGRREERARERDAHAPPAGHVLGGSPHHVLLETQAVQQLSRAHLERGRVQLLEPLVDWLQALVPRSALSERGRLEFVQTRHLQLDVVDNRVERRAVRRLRLLAQVKDVHVLRDGQLAVGERGEQVALPAAVDAQ